jgi:hypothetical protein
MCLRVHRVSFAAGRCFDLGVTVVPLRRPDALEQPTESLEKTHVLTC